MAAQDTEDRKQPLLRRLKPRKRGYMVLYAVLLAAVIAAMVSLRTCRPAAPAAQTGNGRDTLTVAITHTPYSYFVYGDTLGGLDYDMIRRMAADLGLTVKFVPVIHLATSLAALDSRQCDIVAALPPSPELRSKYLFSQGIYTDCPVLIQRRRANGKPTAASPLDLAGDTVHVERFSPSETRMRNVADETGADIAVAAHDDINDEALFALVLNGKIRYAVIGGSTAARLLAEHPELTADTQIAFPLPYSWLVRQSDSQLHERIEEWLGEFLGSDEYRALAEKYGATPVQRQ